ncbi:MAG: MMPL family transporter [Bacteroidota bacterium]
MTQNKTKPTSGFSLAGEKLARWIIERRWLVLIGTFFLTFALGYGFQFLGFNSDSKVFFSKENPQLQAYELLERVYSDDDNVLIAVEATNSTIFTKERLQALKILVDSAWRIPFSFRVDAVTNYQYTRASGDDLYVTDLVEDPLSLSEVDLELIKKVAVNDPILANRLINPSGTVTGVNITAKLPNDPVALNEIVNAVRKMTTSWEAQYPDLKVYLSGNVMLSAAFSESAQSDQMMLVPMVFLIFLIIIGVTTRSVSSTISSFIVIFLSISCGLGLSALLGMDLTAASANVPIVITTLAIADCIHILVTMIQNIRTGMEKREAIVQSIRVNLLPVLLTSITTIIGFLSLNTGDVPPYVDFGNMSALGMFFALLFSIFTLPALMSIMPLKVKTKKTEEVNNRFYNRLAIWVIGNRVPILISSVVFIIASGYFTLQNALGDDVLKYFDEKIRFRNDSDFINANLTGIYNLEFSIGSGESGGVNNPEYISSLEAFRKYTEAQPEVVHVSSFSEIAKKVNKAMHGDSLSHYKVPQTREEAAQYLLIYELSLPYGLDLNNQINVDKSETRFTITLEDITSAEMLAFTARLENWLDQNTPEYMNAVGISYPVIFAYLSKRQIDSLISGAGISALLITFILILSFRSVKYGFISMIPNIAPAFIGFGVWYFVFGMVNLGMTAVFGMTLGIIVDDTVHFLTKYLRAKREQGLSAEEAVRYAYTTVGKAIVATTVVLCAGFIVLAQSSFLLNSALASITVIIMIAALVVDFIALPALLVMVDKSAKTNPSEKVAEASVSSLKTT